MNESTKYLYERLIFPVSEAITVLNTHELCPGGDTNVLLDV